MPSDLYQRYADLDDNLSSPIPFDLDDAGKLVAVSKVGYGADGAAFTRVTASVGLPVVLLAGSAAFGKLAANSGVDIGDVDVTSIAAGDNNIGNVDIVTVPSDPFGVNADAASATGSISAKLRFIASTGIPITGDALTALQLLDDVVYADNAAFTDDTSKFALIGGVYQATPQTITDGRVAPILLDANGRIVVAAHAVTQSGTWNVGTVTTVTTVSTVTNVATIGTSVTPGTGAAHLGKAEDAAHASGDTGVFMLGVRSDTPASLAGNDGDYTGFTFDSAGRAWVNVNNTVTVSGTVAFSNTTIAVTNAGTFATQSVVTNAGTFAVQIDAGAVTSLALLDDVIFTDDAAFTPGTSKVAAIGFQADETGTDSVDEGDCGAARMTLDRKQIVTDLPHTAGGLTPHKTVSAASTNATVVKNAAGQLYEIFCSSVNAAARYLKLYDKATSPTVGTDTPVWTVLIPGNTAGGGIAKTIPKGLAFANGISFALTTEATDAGTTAVAANEIVVNLGYK